MPKTKNVNINEDTYITPSEPKKIDVEKESKKMKDKIGFKPMKLTEVLVTLGEQLYGVELYSYQKEPAYRIIYSVLVQDGAEITMLFSRQSGKSEVIAFTSIVCGVFLPVLAKVFPKELGHFAKGVKMGLIAPQLDQVDTTYSRCLDRLWQEETLQFMEDPDIRDKPLSIRNFKLASGSFLKAQSGAKQSKIESKTYNVVFLDECVTADTKVVTKKGDKEIGSITRGTFVKTYHKNSFVWDKVIAYKKFTNRTVYTITFSNGIFIKATLGHRFYTNYGWITTKEILFLKNTLKLTINCYLCETQKNSNNYEKNSRTTNVRNFIRGRLLGLWRQKIQQVSEVCGNTFYKTKKICSFKIRYTKRVCNNSSERSGKRRFWNKKRTFCNKVITNIQEILGYNEERRWEENGYKRVVIETNSGGDSILVYGRWRSSGKREGDGYLVKQFLVGRTPPNKKMAYGGLWIRLFNPENEELLSNIFSSKNSEQTNANATSILNTEYELQGLRFDKILDVSDLRERIYVKPENFKMVFRSLQKNWNSGLPKRKEGSQREKNAGEKENRPNFQGKGHRKLQIISVKEEKGKRTVIDITTEKTNTFLANNILAHNCQDLGREKVQKSVMPMLASTFGTLIRVGTPNRNRSDFYTKIQQNIKHDRALPNKNKKTKRQHFEYNVKHVIAAKKVQFKKDEKKFHTLYAKAVERDRNTMGENSDSFRMAYKLDWLLDDGMFVTERGLQEYLYSKNRVFKKSNEVEEGKHIIAGLDIAKKKNSTILTIGEMDYPKLEVGEVIEKRVINFTQLDKLDYKTQFEIIAEVLIEYKVDILFFDYTGVGTVLGDFLIAYLEEIMILIPFVFSTPSKSEMWTLLDEDVYNKGISIPYHPSVRDTREIKRFESDAIGLSKKYVGKIMICQKTDGFQDDYMDSLGLMNLAGNFIWDEDDTIEITKNILIGDSHTKRREKAW